ncbi:MAG: PQQ-dependent catabolism-associated CXXCW motif protein [Hyphomicrobiales bacterium]|nr:PQQ-dependent catabolism-associated CXXCW motif protein [Hyphomicrobiales bacterium]MBV9520785.1 PQQ-dependent catabolism-associated CXXCW motif protein [Hyphomicrobiales bacterium]
MRLLFGLLREAPRIALPALIGVGLASFGSRPVFADPPPEPQGYRLLDYKSPVPATLNGARVLTTAQAFALWSKGSATFIDVLPQAPRPAGLPPQTIWRDKPRQDIPGSLWLPDTGYGELHPSVQAYFANGLRRASQGDRTHSLVFYCLAECWQSWNAAKRALSLGYSTVLWYPDGTTGWEAEGHPLETRTAEPRPGEVKSEE